MCLTKITVIYLLKNIIYFAIVQKINIAIFKQFTPLHYFYNYKFYLSEPPGILKGNLNVHLLMKMLPLMVFICKKN